MIKYFPEKFCRKGTAGGVCIASSAGIIAESYQYAGSRVGQSRDFFWQTGKCRGFDSLRTGFLSRRKMCRAAWLTGHPVDLTRSDVLIGGRQ